MIDVEEKLIFQAPCNDGSITKPFYKGSHWGVDFGWNSVKYGDIYAIQEGIVVDNFYSSSCGYSLVLQHNYNDGTHRYSAYIHLLKSSKYQKGASVNQGTIIGTKGNTGKSNGVHLHIGVSDTTTDKYSWDSMKALCNFDPAVHFYKASNVNYTGEYYKNLKYLDAVKVKYPTPVERNEDVKQVEVLIDYLYLRNAPNGKAYSKYCEKGIYNVLSEEVNGDYNWYKIAEGFYIASGGSRTKDLLPKLSEVELLKMRIAELEIINKDLDNKVTELENDCTNLYGVIKKIKDSVADW